MDDFKPFIAKVASGSALTFDEARAAFDIVMSGEATPAQIGGFLMAMRVRGETVDEIAAAAKKTETALATFSPRRDRSRPPAPVLARIWPHETIACSSFQAR